MDSYSKVKQDDLEHCVILQSLKMNFSFSFFLIHKLPLWTILNTYRWQANFAPVADLLAKYFLRVSSETTNRPSFLQQPRIRSGYLVLEPH